MITPCQCALRGLDPRDLDPAVVLLDVREHAPRVDLAALPIAGRDGSRLTRRRVDSLSVSLDFELHETAPDRRKHLCRALARWAMPGGFLTLGDRPGQRLRVTCDAPPVIPSALGWTQPVTVTLTAHDAPWWEDEQPVAARLTAAAGTASLRPAGDLPTPLEASLLCAGDAPVDTVTLACRGGRIRLTGLALAPGETLTLDHDDRALIRLTLSGAGGERSVLPLRDPASDDELWLSPQSSNEIAFTADGAVRAVFSARGRWL